MRERKEREGKTEEKERTKGRERKRERESCMKERRKREEAYAISCEVVATLGKSIRERKKEGSLFLL